MNVVTFPVEFHEFSIEVSAYFYEYLLECFKVFFTKDCFPVLGHKYEVHMEKKNTMPTCSDFT